MNANTSRRARLARYRYPAAALIACLLFGMMELATPWVAGPYQVELNTPAGHLAIKMASQFTPAPSLLRAGTDRQELTYHLFVAGEALLVAAWIGLLWWRIRPGQARSERRNNCLLGVQLAITLALGSLAFHFALATQIAALLPPRRALAWLAVLFALGVGIDAWLLADPGIGLNDASFRAMMGMLTLERCVLPLGGMLAWLVRQEQQARTGLARANAQLRATQALLADTVRSSERMRIARDLHDAVGHHLTALKLHLDLAALESAPPVPAALATSRELAQSLLAQVRSVVSAQRHESQVNLRQALELLAAGIPYPAIRLNIDRAVEACPPSVAQTLLSCVQEAITNTVRHAQATLLVIDIGHAGGAVAVRIEDDGRGAGGTPEGNGLRGMRERLALQGGALAIGKHDPRGGRAGFALAFSLPLAGAPV